MLMGVEPTIFSVTGRRVSRSSTAPILSVLDATKDAPPSYGRHPSQRQEHWSGVRDSNPFVQLGRLVHNLYANPAFARYPHSTGPRHCQSEDWRDFWSGRWESNPHPKLGKLLYCHCTTPAHLQRGDYTATDPLREYPRPDLANGPVRPGFRGAGTPACAVFAVSTPPRAAVPPRTNPRTRFRFGCATRQGRLH